MGARLVFGSPQEWGGSQQPCVEQAAACQTPRGSSSLPGRSNPATRVGGGKCSAIFSVNFFFFFFTCVEIARLFFWSFSYFKVELAFVKF